MDVQKIIQKNVSWQSENSRRFGQIIISALSSNMHIFKLLGDLNNIKYPLRVLLFEHHCAEHDGNVGIYRNI